jgi:hypothetical protein
MKVNRPMLTGIDKDAQRAVPEWGKCDDIIIIGTSQGGGRHGDGRAFTVLGMGRDERMPFDWGRLPEFTAKGRLSHALEPYEDQCVTTASSHILKRNQSSIIALTCEQTHKP